MRIYLAGPMTGIPDFNYPAFRRAETFLAGVGFDVVSPLANGLPQTAPWIDHMRADIPMLMLCDGVALLDGWKDSRGACLERSTALSVGIWVMPINVWHSVARMVRAPAQALVTQ